MYNFKLEQKAIIDTANDEKLIITGIASDTNKDRYNEYVTQETLKSLCEQAKTLNLHYNHKPDEVIGKITDATIKNNQLHITAEILPKYASALRENLEFGIHYGLSIAGLATKKDDGGITSYDLVEISLTEEPANPSTYATVQINKKNLESDCLNGLCYLIDKETKNMSEETKETQEQPVTEEDLNNALNELKTELLETVRKEEKDEIVKEVLEQVQNDLKNEIIDEVLTQLDNPQEEQKEESDVEATLKSITDNINKRFDDFEAKHFQKLDETRKPEDYKTNLEKEAPATSKKSIREISQLYGG